MNDNDCCFFIFISMASKYDDASDVQHWKRFSEAEANPHRKLMPIQGYAEKTSSFHWKRQWNHLFHIFMIFDEWQLVPNGNLLIHHLILLRLMNLLPLCCILWNGNHKNRCLYFVLNANLRDENRQKLKPWFLYLKLFLTGLSRLPSFDRTVFRGVRGDLRKRLSKRTNCYLVGF